VKLLTSVVSSERRRQSGLSGMLAAFPPPGLAPLTRGGTPRPISSWPVADGSIREESVKARKPRRCCGLPCWGFLLVLLIILIIIAAAVVVPLELLVIHKDKSSKSAAPTAIQQCQQNNATMCLNGGTAQIDSGNCACICINGFTGPTCDVSGATGCTTTTLPSYPSNVTLGDAIPRLISESQANFSIPLFSNTILARFSSANLSCVSENALVTFDGFAVRVGNAQDIVVPITTTAPSLSTAAPDRRKRDYPTTTNSWAAETTNGIIIDGSSYSITPSTATSPPTPTSTSTPASSSSSPNPTDLFNITESVLDFARVAVLFILQQESIDYAVDAQGSLQEFFQVDSFLNAAASNVSLGNGNSVDLVAFTVFLGGGNGTVYGQSSTARKRFVGMGGSGRRAIY
jgi:hypothetical protein